MKTYTDAFKQIARAASQMGTTIEEAVSTWKQLAEISYDCSEADEGTNLCRRIDDLEDNVYHLNNVTDNQMVCISSSVDLVNNELTELKGMVDQLRSEMAALTEKPKQNSHLEIFEQIFDNSNYPFLEKDIFSEIDFNINF